jgi:hypothetical protein
MELWLYKIKVWYVIDWVVRLYFQSGPVNTFKNMKFQKFCWVMYATFESFPIIALVLINSIVLTPSDNNDFPVSPK